jgi:WhiB family redox-sensing transcriptional regulator
MTAAQPSPAWMLEGLCRQADGDAWFPEKGQHANEAVAVCQACPVQAECLQYALDHDERYGLWGGLTPPQRAQLRPRTDAVCARCAVEPVAKGYRYCEPCRQKARIETYARYQGKAS